MTNGPKSIQARVKAYEKFPEAAAIFVKKCSKTGQKASEGNPKVPQLSTIFFFKLENIGQSAADKRSKIHRRCAFFQKKSLQKCKQKKQPSPPAGLVTTLRAPFLAPSFLKMEFRHTVPQFVAKKCTCFGCALRRSTTKKHRLRACDCNDRRHPVNFSKTRLHFLLSFWNHGVARCR